MTKIADIREADLLSTKDGEFDPNRGHTGFCTTLAVCVRRSIALSLVLGQWEIVIYQEDRPSVTGRHFIGQDHRDTPPTDYTPLCTIIGADGTA